MSKTMLHKSIKELFQDVPFLTQADVAKRTNKDKVRIAGFLDAMVEYGDLAVKKVGNSKLYYLKKQSN